MECAGAHLQIVGLQDDAAVVRPITLQRQDQALERAARIHVIGSGSVLWRGHTRAFGGGMARLRAMLGFGGQASLSGRAPPRSTTRVAPLGGAWLQLLPT